MAEKFANFTAITTLASGCDSDDTSLTVADGSGLDLSGELRIGIGTELMLVTAVVGNVLTVTRGIEETTAAAHSSGDTVSPVVTADGLNDKFDEVAAVIATKASTTYVDAADSALSAAIALKAPLDSPAFTNNPTAPTQSQGNNSTRLATTEYVDTLGATKITSPANLASQVTGVLPIANGGTALAAVGLLNQELGVSSGGAIEYATRLPTWFIEGLILSNNASDTTHDLDITAGIVVSNDALFTNRVCFPVPTQTKRFDAPWAVGSGNGGMFTGSLSNNTWYRLWSIWGPGLAADVGALAGNSAPTLPTGYTHCAPIGDFWTESASANIRQFTHTVDSISFTNQITLINTTTPAVAASPGTVRAACPARNMIVAYSNYGVANVQGLGSVTGSSLAGILERIGLGVMTSGNSWTPTDIRTNSSGNFFYFADAGTWSAFGYLSNTFRYIRGRE